MIDTRPKTLFLRTSQAADLIGVSRYTLRDWCASGTSPIPFIQLPSGHRRFKRTDIDAYLEARLVGAK